MNRNTRHSGILAAARKTFPPIPHPSWSAARDERIDGSSKLAPEEFWRRLGL